jgi:hypothetical protein
MPVIQRLPEPGGEVWYLAYGSNLSASKFIHDRGITPLATRLVSVPGWTLTMNTAGFPYTEPSFGNMAPIGADEKRTELIGTAYRLTQDMYRKTLASEGGGISYVEVEVRALVLGPEQSSESFAVRSLVSVLPREARPSQRYMNLVRTGASECRLPPHYQDFLARLPVYQPPKDTRRQIGAALFIAVWVPIMALMESITKSSLKRNRSADAPRWVVWMVRAAMYIMWSYHDYVHAPIWGRGDGLE